MSIGSEKNVGYQVAISGFDCEEHEEIFHI